jgi:hypothetical protein
MALDPLRNGCHFQTYNEKLRQCSIGLSNRSLFLHCYLTLALIFTAGYSNILTRLYILVVHILVHSTIAGSTALQTLPFSFFPPDEWYHNYGGYSNATDAYWVGRMGHGYRGADSD